MISRRWKAKFRVSEATVVLAIISALVALGLAIFLRSYYSYNPSEYRPFDGERERSVLDGHGINR